jgi:hypothetical protein
MARNDIQGRVLAGPDLKLLGSLAVVMIEDLREEDKRHRMVQFFLKSQSYLYGGEPRF